MLDNGRILIGKGTSDAFIEPKMANRHGLVAGATGTGKTTTVRVIAESFSMMGVPVFMSDVKGDLGGMSLPGEDTEKLRERLKALKFTEFTLTDFPVCFWDVYGENGVNVRTTISDMGPMLLSSVMGLTDVQQAVLTVVFRIADDSGLLLLDVKDLRSMLSYVYTNREEFSAKYGNVSAQSINAIQRQLLVLEDQGADMFFGEPKLDIMDFMRVDTRGRGIVNMLYCQKLYQNPALYAAFMLFLLSELFERLPEVGDVDKPKIVFFFDEASLLFDGASKTLVQKIDQMARLIRSKGVGVYFITQSPTDIPDAVLAQLSNRVQHALRAYTPAEQKNVRAAASAFRENPDFKTEDVITHLAVGEALVSCLDEKGVPGVVQRATVLPPQSRFGPIDRAQMDKMISKSGMGGKYATLVDRDSAYEHLSRQAKKDEEEKAAQQRQLQAAKAAKEQEKLDRAREREQDREDRVRQREQDRQRREAERYARPVERMASTALNSIGRQLGRELVRGLFGTSRRR